MPQTSKGASQVLLLTPATLIENNIIDSNVDQKQVAMCIRYAEDLKIRRTLGPPLYFSLLDKINTSGLTENYAILLNDYVIPTCIAWFNVKYTPIASFKIKEKGMGQQTGPNYQAASMSDIKAMLEMFEQDANEYTNILIRYLKASQVNNLFPEYTQYTSIEDTPPELGAVGPSVILPTVGKNPGDCCDGENDWKNRFTNLNW